MPRTFPLLLALLAGLLPATGCRSTRPAGTGASADRTPEMSLRVPLSYGSGGGTSAALRLAVMAEVECLTVEPCDTRGLRLTFMNRSTREVRLRFLPVQIVADGETFNVPTPDVPPNEEYVPNGVFFSTLLRREFAPAFANAESVTIRFGQTEVSLTHNERQPVRDLLARMSRPEGGGSAGR